MKDFEYFAARTVEEACSLLAQYGDEAKLLAGGQSLLPLMRMRLVSPSYLIDIKGISDLDHITFDEKEGLRVGALTTHRAIERSPLLKEKFPVLPEMEKAVASVQTRNWGTIGGNLCHADPTGDPATPLIALDAKVKLVSSRAERAIALEDFFTGFSETVLEDDEMLTEIEVPTPPLSTGITYRKFSILEAGTKIAAAAVLITLGPGDGVCRDARIVLSGGLPVPIRAIKGAGTLIGKVVDDDLIVAAAEMAATEADPIPDMHGSKEYRTELLKVLVRGAAKEALSRAKAS